MALRQTVSALGLNRLWFSRLGGAASTAQGAAAFTSSASSDDRQEAQQQQAANQQLPVAFSSTTVPAMTTSMLCSKRPGMPFSPAARMLLGQPRLPTRPGMGQQLRGYNAWSPAQRYFVEGDHVIQAEANRTMQFTGLDAGSFYPFVVYTAVATAIASVFVVLPFVVAPSRVDLDKSSAYECGFDAFGEARQTFSVSFYLVSIMYLLFDIEIAYLFPYVMTHANTPMFWTMNMFLAILVAGFVYEWGVGALEWRESQQH